jgi:hypothetical protein
LYAKDYTRFTFDGQQHKQQQNQKRTPPNLSDTPFKKEITQILCSGFFSSLKTLLCIKGEHLFCKPEQIEI